MLNALFAIFSSENTAKYELVYTTPWTSAGDSSYADAVALLE